MAKKENSTNAIIAILLIIGVVLAWQWYSTKQSPVAEAQVLQVNETEEDKTNQDILYFQNLIMGIAYQLDDLNWKNEKGAVAEEKREWLEIQLKEVKRERDILIQSKIEQPEEKKGAEFACDLRVTEIKGQLKECRKQLKESKK